MNLRSLIVVAALAGAAQAQAQNLVENGDFENGLVGINSDYLHTPQGNTDEGTWWVTPFDPGGAWGPGRSPTNSGRMNANGDDSTMATTNRVWWQTVNVTAGTPYEFSAWAWATAAADDGYQLRFAFDDVQIGGILAASQASLWESFNAQYVAPASGPVEISIVNVSGRTFPNDFMLDDIALVSIPEPSALQLAPLLGVVLAIGRCRRVLGFSRA